MRFFSTLSSYKVNIVSLTELQVGLLIGAAMMFLYMCAFLPSQHYKKHNRFHDNLNYALLFICVGLFNPNGWIHAYIFLLFPYMVCLYYLFKAKHTDRVVWSMVVVSATLATWPDYLFIPSMKDSEGIFSLLAIGAILCFATLLKIKFWPVKAFVEAKK
jgi:hypothetical protein